MDKRERLLTTNDTKKAAVLLTFGAKLRSDQSLTWVNEFASRNQFYDLWDAQAKTWRNPAKRAQINVSFHFETDGIDARSVLGAYDRKVGAEADFDTMLRASGLDPKRIAELAEAHSKAVVQACREALEQREYLVKEGIKKCPETGKLNMIRGPNKTFAMVGTQASLETVAQYLGKIEDA